MPPEPPGYGHIGDEILKHRREKYTGCYCRISFAYLDSTLGPIHLFPKEDGTMVNYVCSPAPNILAPIYTTVV